MSEELKNEWFDMEIGPYITIQSGFPFSSDDFRSDGVGTPLIRIRDLLTQVPILTVSRKVSNEFYVNRGDLLVGMDGDFNIVKWRHSQAVLNQRICKVVGNSKLDTDYLFHLLSIELPKINARTGSTTVKHLANKDIASIFAKIPPHNEQQKIAEILTSVDEVIENTQSQINKLEDLKKATMNELLTKGIGHTEFKETEIGRIPKSWHVAYMRDYAKFSGGSAFNESLQGSESGDFPFIKVSDMNHAENTFWIQRSKNWITNQIKESERIKLFPKNTIVFAKVGAALMLNRRRILTQETAIDNNMMGATAEECNHLFLFWLLCSIDFGKIVQDGAVPSINQSQLGELKVAIPELGEQGEIARILKDLHDTGDSFRYKLKSLENLKHSLMQDLLTGKVRVTVN